MSLAYSWKHCLQRLRWYFLIKPCLQASTSDPLFPSFSPLYPSFFISFPFLFPHPLLQALHFLEPAPNFLGLEYQMLSWPISTRLITLCKNMPALIVMNQLISNITHQQRSLRFPLSAAMSNKGIFYSLINSTQLDPISMVCSCAYVARHLHQGFDFQVNCRKEFFTFCPSSVLSHNFSTTGSSPCSLAVNFRKRGCELRCLKHSRWIF